MKEMDLLMGKFAHTNVATFDTDQLKEYDAVLDINDPDLLNLYLGKTEANESQKSDVLTMFLASHL
jgi:succinate dehydrogenase flavin-adding protein (antitoxin of CptAB toxin-antitoxin module)